MGREKGRVVNKQKYLSKANQAYVGLLHLKNGG